jgi:hypothetical protein
VLLPLTIGTIEFGGYLNGTQAIAAATRAGAEYALDSSDCQNSATGIQYSATSPTIGNTCLTGITAAMKNAFAYGTAITVNSPTSTSTGLACYCDDGSSIACGNTACPTATAPRQVFIKISASVTTNAIVSWPGSPTTLTLKGVTEVRLQ